MSPNNGDKYVTHRWLLGSIVAAVGACATVGLGAWQIHASQPHQGAVDHREFDSLQESLTGRLDRLEGKIDRLLQRPSNP